MIKLIVFIVGLVFLFGFPYLLTRSPAKHAKDINDEVDRWMN